MSVPAVTIYTIPKPIESSRCGVGVNEAPPQIRISRYKMIPPFEERTDSQETKFPVSKESYDRCKKLLDEAVQALYPSEK